MALLGQKTGFMSFFSERNFITPLDSDLGRLRCSWSLVCAFIEMLFCHQVASSHSSELVEVRFHRGARIILLKILRPLELWY